MELPRRPAGDELLPPGELADIRRRLKRDAAKHDLATVIACAFDHRTRMLPFIFADLRMAPAGPRAIAAELADSGFEKTRLVLQQWNRNFRPSKMQLDNRVPDMFLVSSMSLHTARAREMIRDARRIDPGQRPLIIAGGSVCVYEPWELFSPDPQDPYRPDIAVTGEQYVLLKLMEVLLSERATGEPMRSVFDRVKRSGALDTIAGLIYPQGPDDAPPEALVDTGIQQLPGDLDETAHPDGGYRLLEPPSRSEALGRAPITARDVSRHSMIGSLVMTFGCKFKCPYCPIPAYNQRQYRTKSPERIARELSDLNREFGIRHFFGTDDNFFNEPARAISVFETIAQTETDGVALRRNIRLYTEVTVHDTLAMKEHLPLARAAGVRALWLGVEDMSGTLVKKGQTADKTAEAFRLLRQHGIMPMPMMMHHDDQPLLTFKNANGLLNQVHLLRKAGAASLQVLMITPSAGSRLYRDTFTSGMVIDRVGSRTVEPHMLDGNHVIASRHPRPWRKQFNLLIALLYFYNIFRLLWVWIAPKDKCGMKPLGMMIAGVAGWFHSFRRTFGWGLRLMVCKITRRTWLPASKIPMKSPQGHHASHDITPVESAQTPQPVAAER